MAFVQRLLGCCSSRPKTNWTDGIEKKDYPKTMLALKILAGLASVGLIGFSIAGMMSHQGIGNISQGFSWLSDNMSAANYYTTLGLGVVGGALGLTLLGRHIYQKTRFQM